MSPLEPVPIVPVFLSSTWEDLKPERQAVEEALQDLRRTKLVGMESFGSRGEDTRQASLDEVDRSAVYVGIFGGRYGSGITEAEYRRARERDLPCFIYFKDEATIPPEKRERDPEKAGRLEELKRELRQSHTISSPFQNPDQLAARVTADLFNWFLDHHPERAKGPLLEGISRLPTQYEERVRSFLDLYLGTPEEPVPFGGRDAALAALDAWLENPAACPYLLVTAGAGRGKSALLVRWTRSLLRQPYLATVFFPVSIRFRTNLLGVLLPSLVARLSALRGEEVPWSPNMSVEEWRGVLADLLARPLPDGRRLLVILDGLDEAAEESLAAPDLFPLSPHENLRVVVSARLTAGDKDASSWLNRLGWKQGSLAETLDLLPLDRPGVAQVLERMGVPLDRLAADVPVVDQIFRLTEGDPLLVGLYVEDLWGRSEEAARLHPQDLARIPPGLEGFFERWWEDQRLLWGDKAPLREREVRTVLALLATALGPLPRQDLRRLARPDLQLDTLLLTEQVLPPLRRFVTGDGQQQGYVFSHPRLGQHVQGKMMDPDERRDWERRFLTWGEETLTSLGQGDLGPDEVSSYLVQYLGAHLERAGAAPEKLLALVSDGWRQSWERLEGTYSGFLNDVTRAWRSAARANESALSQGSLAPFLGGEVLAALVSASVHSLAGNIGPWILKSLVQEKIWTPPQALSHARQIMDAAQRAVALAVLVPHLPPGESTAVLAEALKAAQTGDDLGKVVVLARTAPYLEGALLAEALALAETLDPGDSYLAGIYLLLYLMPPELLQEALADNEMSSTARAIAEALLDMDEAADLPEAERLQALHPVLSTALELLSRHVAGSWLLAVLLARLPPEDRLPIVAEALDLLRDKDAKLRFESLYALARVVPEPERLAVFRLAMTAAISAEQLAELVPHAPEELLEELSHAVSWRYFSSKAVISQAIVFAELARRKPRGEAEALLDAAWEQVKDIRYESHTVAEGLSTLAPAFSEPRRTEALREALAAARAIPNETFRIEELTRLAPALPPPLLREALDAARHLGDLNRRTQALVQLAIRLPAGDREEPVRSILAGLHQVEPRGYYLEMLAPHLPDATREEALAAALTVPSEGGRGQALSALGPHLSPALAAKALPLARSAAAPKFRAWAVSPLLPWLGEDERQTVLDETLTLLRASGKPEEWARGLAYLAPYLPAEDREREIWEVLALSSRVGSRDNILGTICELAPTLSEPILDELLEGKEWKWIFDPDLIDILEKLTSRLAELGKVEKALTLTFRRTDSPTQQAHVLRNAVALGLPPALVPRMLSAIEDHGYARTRSYLLAQLAPALAGDDFLRAETLARNLEPGLPRVEALIALLGVAPPEKLDRLLRDCLEELRKISQEAQGESLSEILFQTAERLPPAELYPLFHEMLTELGTRARHSLLRGLIRVAPAILKIGGTAAVAESFRAVEQVGRWWP